MIAEPMLTDVTEGEESEVTLAEYLAFWGGDPCYDRKPAEPGDGYVFYNYGPEGDSLPYLKDKLLPAIKRRRLDTTMSELDADNFRQIEEYVTAKIATLEGGGKATPVTLESETFRNENLVTITYKAVRDACKGEPFTMRLMGNDFNSFVLAANRGIDARLQAGFVPARGDKIEGREITVSVESLPVIIRRLFEADDEASNDLAAGMMTTLGFNESGQWKERE